MKKLILSLLILFLIFNNSYSSDLKSMLKKGKVINIQEDKKGNIKFVTGVSLINSSIDKVWNTIIDFEKYPEFIPEISNVKMLAKGKKSIVVEYSIRIKFFKIINIPIRYTLKYKIIHPKKRIEFSLIEGDLKKIKGFWKIEKFGNKTILYYGYYANLKSIKIVDIICKQDPKIEQALLISSNIVTISAIKERCEKK
jgi:ribosome-associated toxin RatA of RatAB toxin-antitoxin module